MIEIAVEPLVQAGEVDLVQLEAAVYLAEQLVHLAEPAALKLEGFVGRGPLFHRHLCPWSICLLIQY